MNKNLLIVGAGIYALVAKEIADSTGCFDEIAFVDDFAKQTPNGMTVIGTTEDVKSLSAEYGNCVVAIGNPDVRLSLLRKIECETNCNIATLISPRAYVSPSAKVGKGTIIEPMAVVHAEVVVSRGCIISAGAVINHGSVCSDACHVDCNAVVFGYSVVPEKTKVCSGEVFKDAK